MLNNSIRVRATASVANVSCGFDCIGYAITKPGDIVTIEKQDQPEIEILMSGIKYESIPVDTENNTAGKAILSLLDTLGSKQGFKVHIEKGIPPGSGIGSSSASAAAAVFGANELLGNPLSLNDILNLPVPKNLFSTAVLPDLIVNTLDARRMLPKQVPLKSAVEQAGNLAGFTLGLHESDFDLLGRSMVDLFAEPIRAELIPGYTSVRQSAMDAGAIGCGISGSGPALFALSDSLEIAKQIGATMVDAFKNAGLKSTAYSAAIHTKPPEILD